MASHTQVPLTARRGKGSWGAIVNKESVGGIESWHYSGFSLTELWQSQWLNSYQARGGSLSSSCWVLLLSQGVRAPLSSLLTFSCDFCLFIFTFPPFDHDLSLKAWLIKSQVFWFQWLFVLECQKGPLLGIVSHSGGKVHVLETY